MAITCPNGHANDEGNRFCDQCGAPLPAAATSAPAAAPEASAAPSTSGGGIACPTCGQENLPGTAFCENCGAQLPPPAPAAAPSEPAQTGAPAGAGSPESANRCSNCGFENEPGNTFCEQCGAALVPGVTPAVPVTDESGASTGTASAAAATAPEAAPALPPVPTSGGGEMEVVEQASPAASMDAGTPEAAGAPAPTPESQPAPAPSPEATPTPQPAAVETPAPAPAEAVAVPEAAAAPAATAAGQVSEGGIPAGAAETCVNCGTPLPPNAKFCLECGTKVEQKPQMVRPTNCQNCGQELLPNAKFCLECGTKVELVPAGAAGAPAQPAEATYQQQAATPTPSSPPEAPLSSALDLALAGTAATSPATESAAATPDAGGPPITPTNGAARTYDVGQAAPAEVAAPAPMMPPPAASPPPMAAAPPPPPMPEPAAPASGPRLISSGGTEISLPPKAELVVGREDPISGIHPDLDMTAHGGEAGGVSRRHAILRQQNGQWSVTDLDSTNYTRIDGTRVPPNTETPLQDGAKVQFGRIEFEFRTQ